MKSSPSTQPAPTKRRRTTGEQETHDDKGEEHMVRGISNKAVVMMDDDEDADSLLMLSMMEGNGDEEAEEKRRVKRRQRWKTLNIEEEEDDNMISMPEPTSTKPQRQEPEEEKEVAPFVEPQEDPAKREDEQDNFDMFSSSVSPIVTGTTAAGTAPSATTAQHELDYDDAEGYYKAVMGEVVSLGYASYKVLGTVGKGVFSTVLKCSDIETSQHTVAIKCVRSNETMAKAAQTEIEILQTFQKHPHPHIVSMMFPTPQHPIAEHKGHRVMVFEFYSYNLRAVLQKFGKGVGLSLVSVRMYFEQLLSALHHMQKHSIVHADIKLDNMLVTDNFSTVKICDFGSAMDIRDSGNAIPTPYLVSRFYRAPEIILGHTPAYTMDLWSVAATVAELFLGNVLFNGTSNNDMLLKIMQILGPLPLKQIKHHTLACRTYPLPQHFSEQHFLQQATDPVTGKAIQKHVSLQQFPTKPLQSLLLKAKSSSDSRVQVLQLSDLSKKCFALDPTRRISLKEALKHEFFQKPSEKASKQQQSESSSNSL